MRRMRSGRPPSRHGCHEFLAPEVTLKDWKSLGRVSSTALLLTGPAVAACATSFPVLILSEPQWLRRDVRGPSPCARARAS